MEQQMAKFRSRILKQLDLQMDVTDQVLEDLIEEEVETYAKKHLLTLAQRKQIAIQLFNSFRKLDVLQELLDRPEVTEIMVNGSNHIFYEEQGELYQWDKTFDTLDKLENVVQQIAAQGNKTINAADPIVDTRLADGSRVNMVLPPAALDGPCITVRKFAKEMMSLERMVEVETLSAEMKAFLELLVQGGYHIFISGGTGSGKTTFLNALSQAIPSGERVVTIEDSAELQLQGVENLVRLETRCGNANGVASITIRDLIRTSLRMRPDRIIVGEVRGGECLELLQANNTGHSGGMSTGHGNSCKDMLQRMESMVLMSAVELPLYAVRGQIASGFDVFIHLGRMRDRSRKVLQICEVVGMEAGEIVLHPLYTFKEQMEQKGKVLGRWIREGQLQATEKLREKGLEKELSAIYQLFSKSLE